VRWLGVEREVAPKQVPPTVLAGVANVIRDPELIAKYAP
jgi:hypothetical protein